MKGALAEATALTLTHGAGLVIGQVAHQVLAALVVLAWWLTASRSPAAARRSGARP